MWAKRRKKGKLRTRDRGESNQKGRKIPKTLRPEETKEVKETEEVEKGLKVSRSDKKNGQQVETSRRSRRCPKLYKSIQWD